MNPNQDLLSVTAFFSALAHAVIILGVSFKLPEIANRSNVDNTLEVVLLNSSNQVVTEQATIVSTNDNEGGGNDEQDAQSPLPYEILQPSPIDSLPLQADQAPKSVLNPEQLVTQQQSDVSIARLEASETDLRSDAETRGDDIVSTASLRRLERERLIAKIAQTQEEYSKRPNKKFLSPTTKADGAAKYLSDWGEKVNRHGNSNFPPQVKARKLSGMLIVTIEINPNGTIADLKILSPSPHKLLNDSALRIIRAASPFAAFPDDEYFNDTDILVVTRSIHFLADNRMISTAAPR